MYRKALGACYRLFFCMLLLIMPFAVQAKSDYPLRPITLVVPYAAGGGTDVVARLVAKRVSEELNKPIVVENKPGAGGGIGAGFVARAEPDGYTFLLGTVSTQSINPALYKNLPYSASEDFVPVSMLVKVPLVVVINSNLPYGNLSELVDAMRGSKERMNYGSQGVGGISHLTAEMLNRQAQVDTVHIPYKGVAPALQDLVAGNIQVLYDTLPALLPHINSGAIRALAVADDNKIEQLPNVPTTFEAGFPELKASTWNAIFAPKGTSREVVDTINAAVKKALGDPELIEKLKSMSAVPTVLTPEELSGFVKAEFIKWAEIVKNTDISID